MPEAVLSECISVDASTYVSSSASEREYSLGMRLRSGIQQGSSYNVWAVAKSSNKPSAVAMTDFCEPGLLQPCPTADPPCVQDMQLACECIGLDQVQVSLNVSTRTAVADTAHLVHYVIMPASLSNGAQFGTGAFPVPSVAQVRAGDIAGTPVAANGSFCVPEGTITDVHVPADNADGSLQAAQDYVLCVAPPDGPNGLYCPEADHQSSSGTLQPVCKPFSTYSDALTASCTLSGCSCSNDADCSAQLSCSTGGDAAATVLYRVVPSTCGGLEQLTCSNLVDAPDADCCPAMEDSLTQVFACCETLAQGEFAVPQEAPEGISGMRSCGDIDLVAYALSTACHRCKSPQPDYCSAVSGTAAQAQAQQQACTASEIAWQVDGSGKCARLSPPQAAALAPEAAVCSEQQLLAGINCGQDECAPRLCDVTTCEPRAGGACSALPGANDTVFVISDSPGTACCMALPYGQSQPSVPAILAGQLPDTTQAADHRCAELSSARQWQELAFAGLDRSVLYVVRPSAA